LLLIIPVVGLCLFLYVTFSMRPEGAQPPLVTKS
jgi:hypothetical protein